MLIYEQVNGVWHQHNDATLEIKTFAELSNTGVTVSNL